MQLRFTKTARSRFLKALNAILFDLIVDGDLDAPEATANALEELAAEIRQQNQILESAVNESAKNLILG